jgi:predicted secreted protein
MTPFDTYCYLRMLESLHNASPTFCRMMKAALKDQVDRNVLSYVEDIVVARKKITPYSSDSSSTKKNTFANMRQARLKLNPKKCVFGVSRGKVLSICERHQSKYR